MELHIDTSAEHPDRISLMYIPGFDIIKRMLSELISAGIQYFPPSSGIVKNGISQLFAV
jgi:hypothetical protein